jgi:hypothetical protein
MARVGLIPDLHWSANFCPAAVLTPSHESSDDPAHPIEQHCNGKATKDGFDIAASYVRSGSRGQK